MDVVFETSNRQTTDRHADGNTSHPYRGESSLIIGLTGRRLEVEKMNDIGGTVRRRAASMSGGTACGQHLAHGTALPTRTEHAS